MQSEKLRQLLKLADQAAETGLNMTETDESMFSPWQEPDQKYNRWEDLYPCAVSTPAVVPPVQGASPPVKPEAIDQRAAQARRDEALVASTAKRIALGVSLERISREVPGPLIIRAQEAAKYAVLSDQEITAIGEKEVRNIRREMAKQRANSNERSR
jgi:hypothetical protein